MQNNAFYTPCQKRARGCLENGMEAILPLKISGDWSEFDLQRAAMLVFSLDRFWTSSKPLKLHVIARTEDVSIVQSALSAQNVAIDVVDENALLSMPGLILKSRRLAKAAVDQTGVPQNRLIGTYARPRRGFVLLPSHFRIVFYRRRKASR